MLQVKMIWCFIMLQVKAIAQSDPLPATNLRVNNMPSLSRLVGSSLLTVDPNSLGLKFSWNPISQERNQHQSQYRIQIFQKISTTQRSLVWNSGTINSTLSRAIYTGENLRSASHYEWTVQWWDASGRKAPESLGLFHVGLKDEWNGTKWIEGAMLRKEFTLTSVSKAVVYVAVAGFFQVRINDKRIGQDMLAGAWKTWNKDVLYFSYDVSKEVKVGANALTIYLGSGWRDLSEFPPHPAIACDKHERLVRLSLLVDGKKVVGSDETWTASDKSPIVSSHVYDGETYDARLEQPNWVFSGFNASLESGWKQVTPVDCFTPAMIPIAMPGITEQKRNKPVSITNVVTPPTCTADILGGFVAEGTTLKLVCEPGTGNITDILFASFGTPTGNCPDFKKDPSCDSDTSLAVVKKLCVGKTSCSIDASDKAFGDPCINVVKSLAVVTKGCTPVKHKPKYVVDFGENLSGWCELKTRGGTSGMQITLRHAEVLQHPPYGPADGNIYVGNLRSAKATDVFILKGQAEEIFEPHFTYHGFRYVEVTGYPGKLSPDDITQIHFRTNVKQRTHFNSSSPILNHIQLAALMGQGSNLMSLPTDCDQRDERLGWMGDSSLSAESMSLNYDLAAFTDNWLRDIVDEQGKDGDLPDTVPYARYGHRPSDPSWSAALPNNLWARYDIDGDVGPAGLYWDQLMLYFDDIAAQIKKAGSLKKWPASYGDWVPAGPKVSNQVPAAFNYIDNLKQSFIMAKALGKYADEQKLRDTHASIITNYNNEFYNKKNICWDNCGQSSYALSVMAGAVNETIVANVTSKFVNDIVNTHKNHVTVGIIGAKALFPALCTLGKKQVAVDLAEQTSYPSWGYMLYNDVEPATTSLWELWNSPTQGPGMNSRNHHMFSSISKWIVQTIGGIEGSLCKANQAIRFHAAPAQGISWSSLKIESSCGLFKHKYRRHGGTQCSKIAVSTSSSSEAILDCGSRGGWIEKIEFASLGMPDGGCGNFKINRLCHFPNTINVVEKMCIHKQSCRIPSDFDFWNMAKCDMGEAQNSSAYANPHRLFLQAKCSKASSIDAHIHVPVGTRAHVILPRYELATGTVRIINEDQTPIPIIATPEKKYTKMLKAQWNDDNTAAVINVGSGEYDFILQSII